MVLTAFPPTEDEPPATPAKAEEALRPRYLPASFTAEPPVVAALRCFMDRRPDAALEQLARYDAENQDILLHLLPLTARMAEGPISQADPQELAAVIDQMQGVIMALRPRAALVMDKVCFCRQVRKFGVYESLGEKPSFRRGELVEMYCEVRNIACERTTGAQGEYRTHLQNSLEIREIRDPVRGFRIQRETKKADLCHTPQHDYYLHYSFAIRDDMKPGPYVLTVEVVDVPTGRKINRKLEFVVRAE